MKKIIFLVIGLTLVVVAGFYFSRLRNRVPTAPIITCATPRRKADVCADVYAPVCAKINIQCIKAPCNPIRQTFQSGCDACKNPFVESYTNGECPAK